MSNSCFVFSDSEGSNGVGIGSAASTGILSSCAGSSTTGWTIASKKMEFSNFAIPQLVHMNSVFVHMTFCDSPARTHDLFEFCVSSARTNDVFDFCEPARTHDFCESPAGTHEFCESPARTHEFCGSPNDLICALTKYTPFFLIRGSRLSPYFKKGSLARCVSVPFSHR